MSVLEFLFTFLTYSLRFLFSKSGWSDASSQTTEIVECYSKRAETAADYSPCWSGHAVAEKMVAAVACLFDDLNETYT